MDRIERIANSVVTSPQAMSEQPKVIDWDAIEPQYSAGIRTLRDIAQEFGITHAGIRRHAEKHGWTRDLSVRIRIKADALVSKQAVSTERDSATELETIEANAVLQATIRREQRQDITRSRRIVMALLQELEIVTGDLVIFEQLAELLYTPGDSGHAKAREVYNKALTLGSRSKTMGDLANSLKTLIMLEREAFGIDDKRSAGGDGILASIEMHF